MGNDVKPYRQAKPCHAGDVIQFEGLVEDKNENFLKEIIHLVENIKTSRPRPGFEVRLPGERGFEALKDCQINGIPLDEEKIQYLQNIAQENNIEPVTAGD